MSDTTFLLHKTIRRLPPLSRKHFAFLFDDLFSVTPYSLWGGLQHVRHLPGFGTSHSWSLFSPRCLFAPCLPSFGSCADVISVKSSWASTGEFSFSLLASSDHSFLFHVLFTCPLSPIFKLVSFQLACCRAYEAVCFAYRLSLVPMIVPGTLRALIYLYWLAI